MYFNMMKSFAILAAFVFMIMLTACDGGTGESDGSDGNGGDNEPTWVTLLSDDFSYFPNSNWNVIGTVTLDDTTGDESPPSIKIVDNSSISSAVNPFSTQGGVQINVSASFSDFDTGNNGVGAYADCISVINQNTARVHAYLGINTGGSITYNIDNRDGVDPKFTEPITEDQFDRYAFIVWADGTAEWRKNGITKVSSDEDIGSEDLYLKIKGIVISHFDDVLVGYWSD